MPWWSPRPGDAPAAASHDHVRPTPRSFAKVSTCILGQAFGDPVKPELYVVQKEAGPARNRWGVGWGDDAGSLAGTKGQTDDGLPATGVL